VFAVTFTRGDCKRTWLSLAWASSHPRQRRPRSRSGRVGKARSRWAEAPAPPGEGAAPTANTSLPLAIERSHAVGVTRIGVACRSLLGWSPTEAGRLVRDCRCPAAAVGGGAGRRGIVAAFTDKRQRRRRRSVTWRSRPPPRILCALSQLVEAVLHKPRRASICCGPLTGDGPAGKSLAEKTTRQRTFLGQPPPNRAHYRHPTASGCVLLTTTRIYATASVQRDKCRHQRPARSQCLAKQPRWLDGGL
jgi:hypothetical protein